MTSPIYEVLAGAFAAEEVDTLFTLMGNGNMYWSRAMARTFGIRTIHARHEHCAVAMADGYSRATGRVGVASVTCGPGFTQIMTALTAAALGRIPLVIFAGEAPIKVAYHVHRIDQAPLALATGAHFIPIRTMDRVFTDLQEAFYVARADRRPVVISVPEDFQQEIYSGKARYVSSKHILPTTQTTRPDLGVVAQIADQLAAAERPIILAGRGAVMSGAERDVVHLARRCGALLSTTLYAKGLFDGDPFDIGIAGGFSTRLGRELFADADMILAVGASLGHYTTDGGHLYPHARVLQIDVSPRGLWQGRRVADFYLQSDATLGVQALLAALQEPGNGDHKWRTPSLAERLVRQSPDDKKFPIEPDTVDPRDALLELDRAIPKDWDIVCGGAHYFNFVLSHLRGRRPERYHIVNEFGAIGSALSVAIGIAAHKGDGKVLLIEGDGSFLMHVQELETIVRHGVRLLTCIMNDGAYGAELHKFRGAGIDPDETIHGRGNLAALAQGFGLRGTAVRELGRFADIFAQHCKADRSEVWDVHISDNVPSAQYRRWYFGER